MIEQLKRILKRDALFLLLLTLIYGAVSLIGSFVVPQSPENVFWSLMLFIIHFGFFALMICRIVNVSIKKEWKSLFVFSVLACVLSCGGSLVFSQVSTPNIIVWGMLVSVNRLALFILLYGLWASCWKSRYGYSCSRWNKLVISGSIQVGLAAVVFSLGCVLNVILFDFSKYLINTYEITAWWDGHKIEFGELSIILQRVNNGMWSLLSWLGIVGIIYLLTAWTLAQQQKPDIVNNGLKEAVKAVPTVQISQEEKNTRKSFPEVNENPIHSTRIIVLSVILCAILVGWIIQKDNEHKRLLAWERQRIEQERQRAAQQKKESIVQAMDKYKVKNPFKQGPRKVTFKEVYKLLNEQGCRWWRQKYGRAADKCRNLSWDSWHISDEENGTYRLSIMKNYWKLDLQASDLSSGYLDFVPAHEIYRFVITPEFQMIAAGNYVSCGFLDPEKAEELLREEIRTRRLTSWQTQCRRRDFIL